MTMMRTGSLLDGTDPTTLGTELNYNDDEERYQNLFELVQQADDSELIAWFGATGTGTIVRSDAEMRARWKLPDDCAGLVLWVRGTGNEEEASMLRMLRHAELEQIAEANEFEAVGAVVEHYEGAADDGHPAYRLRRMHDRRASRFSGAIPSTGRDLGRKKPAASSPTAR